jgi:hypothetical protein
VVCGVCGVVCVKKLKTKQTTEIFAVDFLLHDASLHFLTFFASLSSLSFPSLDPHAIKMSVLNSLSLAVVDNNYPRVLELLRRRDRWWAKEEGDQAIGLAAVNNRVKMLSALIHYKGFDASSDDWWVMREAWEYGKYKAFARLVVYRWFHV